MTRDAEVSTGDFLSLVLSGIGSETDVGVVQGVLRQLKSAIDQFAARENRTGYLIRLSDAMRDLAETAEPASDHQLAFTRAFVSSATTDEQLDLVAALLDGTVVWEGLAVDTDLRWFMLQRLVVSGRLEDDAIEAEQDADDTATGRRQAAVARAARPTSVAKELAWAEIIDRTDLPNAILDATIGGFVQPDQVDLLRHYRDRYFEALPRVWQERTTEMAQAITMGLYPFLVVEDETIAATDEFLAGDLNSACRRLVSEGRDGVLRAQRREPRMPALLVRGLARSARGRGQVGYRLGGFVEVHDQRMPGVLREQRHSLAHPADQVIRDEAGLHRQGGELARPVVQRLNGVDPSDDLDGTGRRIDRHEDGRGRIREQGVLRDRRLTSGRQRTDVHPEAEAADGPRPLDHSGQVRTLRVGQGADLTGRAEFVGVRVTSGH